MYEEFWSTRPLSAFTGPNDLYYWAIALSVCLVLISYDFFKNAYRVGKLVVPTRWYFAHPPKEKPAPGQFVTVVGIVSSPDGKSPVRVKIRELGNYVRGNLYWHEAGRKVTARPFSIVVPTWETRIDIEPDNTVELRTSADESLWRFDLEANCWLRFRKANLKDGDHAIIQGMLVEETVTEMAPGDYRAANLTAHKRLVIRPAPEKTMIIATEELLDEVSTRAGKLHWYLGFVFFLYTASGVTAIVEDYTEQAMKFTLWVAIVSFGIRIFLSLKDRVAWFDRAKPPQVHRSIIDGPDVKREEIPENG